MQKARRVIALVLAILIALSVGSYLFYTLL